MGLNDIELSPASLVALYGSLLVESENNETKPVELSQNSKPAIVEKQEPVAVEKSEPVWKHLGNNQKQILVAINYSDSPILPDSALNLLTNMLNACKLSLADVAIINFHHYRSIGGKEILSHYKSRQILLFGIEPIEFGLPVNFPQFQVQRVATATFLFSPTLEEIAADKLIKTKLWVSLQQLFKV